MSSLILPRRFNSQPQGAVEVDWLGHGRGLVRAYTPASAEYVADITRRHKQTSVDGASRAFGANEFGTCVYYIVNQTNPGGFDADGLTLTTKNYSIGIVGNWPASRGGVGNSPYYFDSLNGRLAVGHNNTDTIGVYDGAWRQFAYVPFGKAAQSIVVTLFDGGFHRIFVDGMLIESISAGTPTNIGGTTRFLYRYADYDTSVYQIADLQINAVNFWDRALTHNEAATMSANPWQLFRAKPRVLYFDVGGGGGNPTGTGSLIISATTASGSGVIVHKGSGALSTPSATLAGSGKVTHNGTGDLDTPAVTASGTAKLVHKGIGDLTTPAVTLDGTGSIVVAGAVTGSGALTTPAITLSGSGKVTHKAQGDVVAPAVTLDGAGKLTHTGTGDITTPAVELDGYDQATPVEPDLPSYGGWRYHPYLHIRRKEDEKDPEIEASPLPAKQIKKAKRAEVARTAERESEEQDQFERGLLDKLESVLEGKVLAVADDLTEARNKKLETQRIEAYKLELLQIAIHEEDELMLILLAA